MQIALNNLSEWCKLNGMAINTSKTKLMLITTHQKRAVLDSDQSVLVLNNENLNTINKDKILGVSIDNNVSWSSHIDQICKRYHLFYGFYLELKNTFLLNTELSFTKLTFSLILTIVMYVVWGGTSQLILNRLFSLQKHACKIILDYNVENVLESMQEIKILTIYEIISTEIKVYVQSV